MEVEWSSKFHEFGCHLGNVGYRVVDKRVGPALQRIGSMTPPSINGEKSRRQASAARHPIEQIGSHLDLDLWIRLWDGSRVPLGRNVTGELTLSISSPGVISSILRRPTLDRVLRHYLDGQ